MKSVYGPFYSHRWSLTQKKRGWDDQHALRESLFDAVLSKQISLKNLLRCFFFFFNSVIYCSSNPIISLNNVRSTFNANIGTIFVRYSAVNRVSLLHRRVFHSMNGRAKKKLPIIDDMRLMQDYSQVDDNIIHALFPHAVKGPVGQVGALWLKNGARLGQRR